MKKFIMLLCLMALIYGLFTMAQDLKVNPARDLSAVGYLGGSSVEGKPTLSAAFVDKVLSASNSKAVGTGQALYNLSMKYGIDDAYALAFFGHESVYGTTGVARATLSLGNIRCSDGYQCIEGF